MLTINCHPFYMYYYARKLMCDVLCAMATFHNPWWCRRYYRGVAIFHYLIAQTDPSLYAIHGGNPSVISLNQKAEANLEVRVDLNSKAM